ncbi:MAG: hypothetical protein AMJ94_04910 [Deltaproteobacteria bacterium SM23_61]|nr:MAG: hypothetical protein AMJ94_04910 [Deltaproteobacteria bacterium SM23_61]
MGGKLRPLIFCWPMGKMVRPGFTCHHLSFPVGAISLRWHAKWHANLVLDILQDHGLADGEICFGNGLRPIRPGKRNDFREVYPSHSLTRSEFGQTIAAVE